jgi:hypothetical protein
MIEVEFVGCTAFNAASAVSPPHLQFDRGGNNPPKRTFAAINILSPLIGWRVFNPDQAESEHISRSIILDSSVYKMEIDVVGPYPSLKFFVDSD